MLNVMKFNLFIDYCS